jgi:hypothetical protein
MWYMPVISGTWEAEVGESWSEANPRQKLDLLWKNKRAAKRVWYGSSSRVLACQMQGFEFKTSVHQKKWNRKKDKQFYTNSPKTSKRRKFFSTQSIRLDCPNCKSKERQCKKRKLQNPMLRELRSKSYKENFYQIKTITIKNRYCTMAKYRVKLTFKNQCTSPH